MGAGVSFAERLPSLSCVTQERSGARQKGRDTASPAVATAGSTRFLPLRLA